MISIDKIPQEKKGDIKIKKKQSQVIPEISDVVLSESSCGKKLSGAKTEKPKTKQIDL